MLQTLIRKRRWLGIPGTTVSGLAGGLVLLLGFLILGPGLRAQKQVSEADAVAALKRCSQCHGPSLQMSKLDLSTREGMLKGGEKGPAIVPGNAEASPLYRRIAGLQTPAMPMPPVPALTGEEVQLVKEWIDQGAKWPVGSQPVPTSVAQQQSKQAYTGGYIPRTITEQDRQWWAFQKPVRRQAPSVSDARWSRNPIDAFVRGMQEKKGLTVAPQADRRTLIRRAYLDLIGLLPPPETVDAFVNDPAPDAYDKLIDRLLASPNYGERWGRFWLDVVRYADSSGFEFDINVDNAWRYRDYVIKAFNEDKPYDRFVTEQLAGDELDKPTYDSLTATTYYRIGPRVRFREKNYPSYRFDYMDDMVRTTFQGFMGLSVNCARCHDHKFDPITRLDYYKSVAAFWGYVDYDQPLAPKSDVDAYNQKLKELGKEMTPLQQEIARIEKPYREKQREELVQQALKKFPPDIQAAINTPEAKRTPGQKLLVAQVIINPDEADPDNLVVDVTASAKARAAAKANQVFGVNDYGGGKTLKLNDADEKKRSGLQARIRAIEERLPAPLPVADGVRDGDFRLSPDGLGDSHIPGTGRPDYGLTCCFIPAAGQKYDVPPLYFAAKGEDLKYDATTFLVEPGFLTVLSGATPPPAAHTPNRPDYQTSGRRRALAEAIVSPDNPLTARVIVNRIWGWHFGTGIVATPGNFGKMGVLPSNPELLDWLTTEFVQRGWSIKQMQRLIMTSETYKMASAFSPEENLKADPTDVYLWRFPPHRLEAEIIRDITLSASGQINTQMGGEPFFPPIPASLRADQPRGTWDLTKEEPSTWRRSIYAYVKRGLKYPMFEVFDEPDLNVTCERRAVSTVPTQALTLLNNDFTLIQADYLAGRVSKAAGAEAAKQVRELYRIALSREPTAGEMQANVAFLERQTQAAAARGVVGEKAPQVALTDLAHVLLNLNEFVYVR